MLSEDTLQIFRLVYKVAAVTHCVPLYWDGQQFQPLPKAKVKGLHKSAKYRQWLSRIRHKLSWEPVMSTRLELGTSTVLLCYFIHFIAVNFGNVSKMFQAVQILFMFAMSGPMGTALLKVHTV